MRRLCDRLRNRFDLPGELFFFLLEIAFGLKSGFEFVVDRCAAGGDLLGAAVDTLELFAEFGFG